MITAPGLTVLMLLIHRGQFVTAAGGIIGGFVLPAADTDRGRAVTRA